MSFKEYVIKSHPTGSRYICNPPVLTTDNDTVFLVNSIDYELGLMEEGFTSKDSEIEYDTRSLFQSWRKDIDNYIVTMDQRFYEDYVLATEGAKALNLTNKDDRIKLFKAIFEARLYIG